MWGFVRVGFCPFAYQATGGFRRVRVMRLHHVCLDVFVIVLITNASVISATSLLLAKRANGSKAFTVINSIQNAMAAMVL